MKTLRILFLLLPLRLLAGGVCEAAQFTSPAITVTNTTTSGLDIPKGDGLGAVFYVNVTAIGAGDTWTFKLQQQDGAGNAVDITSTTSGITSIGRTAFTLASPFTGGNTSPFPTHVVATRSVNGGTPTVTYTISGFLTNGIIEKQKANLLSVCKAGCKYSTITSALTDITDASASNRYTVTVGPGIYDEGPVSAKSYVSVVGESRNSVTIRNIVGGNNSEAWTFPQDVTEATIRNVTLISSAAVGVRPASTGSVNIYVDNCILGTVDTSLLGPDNVIDSVHALNVGGALGVTNLYVTNSIHQSSFDHIALTGHIHYVGYNNDFSSVQSGYANSISIWRNIAVTEGDVWMEEHHSRVYISTDNAGQVVQGISYNPSSAGTPQQVAGVELDDVDITFLTTNASRTAATLCLNILTVPANSNGYRFIFNDVRCRIVQTSTSGALTGLNISNDSDLANTPFRWIGGRIELTGGASRTDVSNALTASGATVLLSGVEHTGTYSGAGTTQVIASPLNATGIVRDTPIATAPATCSIGDRYVDTSGAFCVCTAANTWTNTSGVGTCV